MTVTNPESIGHEANRHSRRVALVGILAALAVTVALVLLSVQVAGVSKTVEGTQAVTFYQTDVSRHLSLPPEATVVQVKTYPYWFPERYELEFSLPDDRTPESWLETIWADNGFAANSQTSTYEFTAYHSTRRPNPWENQWRYSEQHHGRRSLTYDPETQRYVATIGTD